MISSKMHSMQVSKEQMKGEFTLGTLERGTVKKQN